MIKQWSRWWLHKGLGWRVVGDFPQDLDKYILIGGPHTSNWDFVMAMLLIWSKGVKFTILGKKELFTPLTGWFFRRLGVVPVDRHGHQNFVSAAAQWFKDSDQMVVALSPEGTRKKVTTLRTGFYHLARAADVPVVMIGADYPSKQFVISEPRKLSDDVEGEIEKVQVFLYQFTGKIAGRSFRF